MLYRCALALLLMLPLTLWASTVTQTIASARIVDAARAQLDNCLGADKANAQVSVVGRPDDVIVMPGNLSIDARRPEGRWPRARVGIPVDIRIDGEIVRSATVWFAVSVQRQVLTYSADAKIGAVASSLTFAMHDVDVATMQSDSMKDPAALAGMRLRHAVVAGRAVTGEDFERIPDVDRQQRIDVLASYGLIRMQTKGTAVGRGNKGDTVSVLVDGAEAPVQARVTDKGVVDVVE